MLIGAQKRLARFSFVGAYIQHFSSHLFSLQNLFSLGNELIRIQLALWLVRLGVQQNYSSRLFTNQGQPEWVYLHTLSEIIVYVVSTESKPEVKIV